MAIEPTHDQERGVSIVLRYRGGALDDGSMDVYQAAANMVAFSDYVVAATHHLYGDGVQVKAEVNAFKEGSFETDLTFQVLSFSGALLTLSAPHMDGVVGVVKESLDLFRFLQGRAAAKVERIDNSNNVTVTNVNGNVTIVQTETLTLLMDEKAGKAAGQFVGEALAQPGVQELQITSDGKRVASVSDDEAKFYHPILEETPIIEQVVQMGLMIETASFREGNKWTMSEGEASLQFTIEDEDFLARIDGGEAFRKGDVLYCDVRVTQTKVGQKLRIQRAVIRVHSHQSAIEQSQFDL